MNTLTGTGHSSLLRKLIVYALWLCFFVFISLLSYHLRSFTNSLLLFLPIALSIVLVQWYGYSFLPIIYINGIINLLIWKANGTWAYYLLIATHEPLVASLSRLLTTRLMRRPINECFSNTNSFALFTLLGFFLPVAANSLYTYHYSFVNGDMEKVGLLFLSDFITVFSLSLPLLYFIKPNPNGSLILTKEWQAVHFTRHMLLEFWIMVFVFVLLSFIIPFSQYWFIYGIAAVIIGMRQGFESVLLINCVVFFVNYMLPLIESSTALITTTGSTQLINVHLGNATMLFISSLVGRGMSDLKATQKTLIEQNKIIEKANEQLNQTNKELDRFVYSVSHDLSAPLKSIQGLIHLSKMEKPESQSHQYLDMMEHSATRLNDFINEVLDYSRTSRRELELEQVNLSLLLNELKEKFIFHEEGKKVKLNLVLERNTILTDATLLKIGLGNLLSNAIKFQRKYQEHIPLVEVKSFQLNDEVHIEVSDNGEGIQESHVEKIFDMFYRATSKSPGSGLGLYIAREAIDKLGGKIAVKTEYGTGSTFTIVLPV